MPQFLTDYFDLKVVQNTDPKEVKNEEDPTEEIFYQFNQSNLNWVWFVCVLEYRYRLSKLIEGFFIKMTW